MNESEPQITTIEKWIPKQHETVFFINVYSKYGYDECWYRPVMQLAFERNMVFKTREQARKRVAELGWK